MKIVYLGSGEFGIDALEGIAQSGHDLDLIVTQPPHRAGRGRKPRPTAVAKWAHQNSLACIETENINNAATIDRIAARKPDIIVVIAFGQYIGAKVRNLAPKGCINVHASLLPKYRGAAPINWAVINAETETGISIITVEKKMDAGDIITSEKTYIDPNETAGQLHDRLASLAPEPLLHALQQIENGTAVYTPQDETQATFAPKLKKSDGYIDFDKSAEQIKRNILGLWPWPRASAYYVAKETEKCTQVGIAAADVVHADVNGSPPGLLNENLNIICAHDALHIIRIKPQGSGLMDFRDFVNGRHCSPGDLFMKIEKTK